MKKIIIIAVALIIITVAWYGYKLYSEKTPDLGNKKPDIVMNAAELIAAFSTDTSSARKMYVDKIIELKGTVKSIDTTGAIVFGEEGNPSVVTVSLDRRHIEDYKKLKVGYVGVIQGRCTGYTKGSNDDLIESLGTTVELNFAVVENKK